MTLNPMPPLKTPPSNAADRPVGTATGSFIHERIWLSRSRFLSGVMSCSGRIVRYCNSAASWTAVSLHPAIWDFSLVRNVPGPVFGFSTKCSCSSAAGPGPHSRTPGVNAEPPPKHVASTACAACWIRSSARRSSSGTWKRTGRSPMAANAYLH